MLPSLCAHLQGYFANDLSKVINRSINTTKQNRSRFMFRIIYLFRYLYFPIKLSFSVPYFFMLPRAISMWYLYSVFYFLLSITIRNILIFYRLSLIECFFISCFSYILSLCTGWEIYALLITSLCIIKPLRSWDVKRMHCNTFTGRFRFRMNYNRNSRLFWHIVRSKHVNYTIV